MKKLMQKTAEIKMLMAIIWIGMFVLYILSKTILGIYQVSFITILELLVAAIIVGVVKLGFETRFFTKRFSNNLILFLQYLVISVIVMALNQLFAFYILQGIEYLYLLGFITFSYCGGLLGFYIMDYYDVNMLNNVLKEFHEGE